MNPYRLCSYSFCESEQVARTAFVNPSKVGLYSVCESVHPGARARICTDSQKPYGFTKLSLHRFAKAVRTVHRHTKLYEFYISVRDSVRL